MDKTAKDLYQKVLSTPEKIKEWDYPKTISSEISQTDDIEVDLLIGVNCMKALESLKVIASNNGGSYAYQTRLGWCIVATISNMVGKDSTGCHHIAVQDAISSKIADHEFVVDESIFFFKLGFTPCKAEQPLWSIELQEKKHKKKIIGYTKSVQKEPTAKRCLLILNLKSLRS